MDAETLKKLLALVTAHAWIPLAALVIGLVVRLLKSDTKIPITIPPEYRRFAALVLGVASAALESVVAGVPWKDALLGGGASVLASLFGHYFVIDKLRDGKELALPGLIRPGAAPGPGKPITVRPPPVPPLAMLALGALLALSGCPKPAGGPGNDADASSAPYVEAGVAIANGVCSPIEGIDDSGVARNVCANVDEIASIVQFITSLRTAPDAGAKSKAGACANLPGTTFCATSDERAKGILYLSKVRASRLMLDGGAVR